MSIFKFESYKTLDKQFINQFKLPYDDKCYQKLLVLNKYYNKLTKETIPEFIKFFKNTNIKKIKEGKENEKIIKNPIVYHYLKIKKVFKYVDNFQLLILACQKSDLNFIKLFVKLNKINNDYIYYALQNLKNLEIAKYLCQIYKSKNTITEDNIKEILVGVFHPDQFEIFKFIWENISDKKKYYHILAMIVKTGNLEMTKWAFENFEVSCDDLKHLYYHLFENENLNVVKFVMNEFPYEDTNDHIILSMKTNNLMLFKYFIEKNMDFKKNFKNEDFIQLCVEMNATDIIKYVYNSGYKSVIENSLFYDRRFNMHTFLENILVKTVMCGNIDLFKFLFKIKSDVRFLTFNQFYLIKYCFEDKDNSELFSLLVYIAVKEKIQIKTIINELMKLEWDETCFVNIFNLVNPYKITEKEVEKWFQKCCEAHFDYGVGFFIKNKSDFSWFTDKKKNMELKKKHQWVYNLLF